LHGLNPTSKHKHCMITNNSYAYHMRFLAEKHDQKTWSTMFSMQRVVW